MRLLRQAEPPCVAEAQTRVGPPFTTAADRDALYARIHQRTDFATMCGNAGVPEIDVPRYATQERFSGCVGVHLNFEGAYMYKLLHALWVCDHLLDAARCSA